MAELYYVVSGAQLQCDKGTALGKLKVLSQQKLSINDKLQATNKDKFIEPPFFGNCACTNKACTPALLEWQYTSRNSGVGENKLILDNSQILCSQSGIIKVKDANQTIMSVGEDETELDKVYAKLQGEIIFANGYLSSSLGGALNALLDLNPDEPSPNLKRGWNANEEDKIDTDDILLASQVQKNEAMSEQLKKAEATLKKAEITIKVRYPIFMSPAIVKLPSIPIKIKVKKPIALKDVPEMTLEEKVNTFYGYWNDIENKKEATNTYAKHFNAGRNQHFLNGSHGLGSNGAHRLDHGIAQGYHWAKYQWLIFKKEDVDAAKEKVPYIKSYSPAYKPLTIVMHSQGNAPGVGFALGAMKYASEQGWEQIPLNLIFLGVHQPQNLWGDAYEKFVNHKVKHYLADSNFWDTISTFEKTLFLAGGKYIMGGVILKQYLSNKADRDILKYLNGLAELFSSKYHKLRNKRGIYEHLQAITNFFALQERAIQFTFSNDHGDMVIRDGDIPEIASACNPKGDTSLYSVEFLPKGQEVPSHYSKEGKEIFAMDDGGHLVIPKYAVKQRIVYNKETGEKETWKDYRSIAKDWGNAMSTYDKLKREYHKKVGKKLTFLDLIIPVKYGVRKSKEMISKLRLNYWFRKVIYHYARIQIADLYAHFSPVGLILEKDLLKDTPDFNDGIGTKNIWERIKKTGEGKFYRVEYDKTDKTEEAKREFAKNYVEGEGQNLLIYTHIADTPYINNVIKAYVHGDTTAAKQLYKEPLFSDKEQAALDKFIKMLGNNMPKDLREATKLPNAEEIEKIQEYIEREFGTDK